MPIVRIGPKLVYFAHVPKCAGSSVEDYLHDRFGALALVDRKYISVPPDLRWTRSSPQHVDWAALARMFPADFFDACFAVVRHPLDRAVSAFRFQAEVEGTVPEGIGFGDWLQAEAAARQGDPYRSDNHSRPQSDFLPPVGGALPCTIFHMEHGLDALIPYFDALAGVSAGPRALRHTNKAGHNTAGGARRQIGEIKPDAADRALVAEIYSADFARLGYHPDQRAPLAPAPALSAQVIAQATAERARAQRPLWKLADKIARRLRRWQWE
ncbi:sulfotransferase family protein [Rhodobacter sp. Har01]|uniref:sulfotransferase family 2 domain-containing protein n=1 Tax=Rhodobacter sp. Har01 TaxID=2883999 RepID=UPI001D0787CF|nr:sulfotransferase family 2 domain-containing protein [Rhodobacter sp. Har01]MCB6179838.1 sulfotransferase family protein [Rhodobacter sp. Har01]